MDKCSALEGMMNLMQIAPNEREELRRGFKILDHLGWPDNYVDLGMCKRAVNGRVPRYEGIESYTEYRSIVLEEEQASDS